jgi:ketosteroid isomerase-like protein
LDWQEVRQHASAKTGHARHGAIAHPQREGMEMKRSVFLALCIPFVFSAPASADDMKQEVSKMISAYMDCFNKQDPACIAALYTKDGFLVNPAGKHEVSVYYGNAFKAGLNKLEIATDEVWQVDDNTPGAMGKFRATGKNAKGEPMEVAGVWTAVYAKQDGIWKSRMLTVAPAPPK